MMLDQIVHKQRVLADEIARGATREFVAQVSAVLGAVRHGSPMAVKGRTLTMGVHIPRDVSDELTRLQHSLGLGSKRDVIYAAMIVGMQVLKDQEEHLK